MLPSVLLVLFGLTAAAYMFSMPRTPYKGDFALKALPLLCLAAYVALAGRGGAAALVVVGLLFSAGGDVALALDRQKYFVVGLSLFLVAHLFYIAALVTGIEAVRFNIWVGMIVLFSLSVGAWLFPVLGKLRGPVMVYMVVISVMGIAAALHPAAFPFLLPGALLFILSDSLIAIDKFRRPVPYAHTLIMITYYLGQLGIALGWG
jgi:uncharacterized membrane protein YhhN